MSQAYTQGRDIILQKAGKLLSQRGYFGVSMQDIADASNIKKATLYYHFKSKDDLIEELLKKSVTELKEELRAVVLDRGNPADKIFHLVKTILDFRIRHPEINLLSMTISSDESQPVLQLIENLQQEVTKLIRELVGGVDFARNTATKTVISLSSMILGLVMSPFASGEQSPENVAKDITTLLFREPLGEDQ
jgi:AcrR family transcriptional regulator